MLRLLPSLLFLLWVHGSTGNTTHTTTTSSSLVGNTSSASSTSIAHHAAEIPSPPTPPPGTAGLSSKTTTGNATCPSRTVNYITHTLPRQCLRTDRVPYNSTSVSSQNATETVSPNSEGPVPIETASSTTHHEARESTASQGVAEDGSLAPATSAKSTVDPSAIATLSPDASTDEDSPLDTANFLSFEEWKKQNLAKLGQSPEDVGRGQPVNPNRPRPGINNALDTLGEESEIDLDFSGFGASAQLPLPDTQTTAIAGSGASTQRQAGSSIIRSKDAGKTCKERTNYASFDCSATILKSNKECKSASSVLVENKDSYMLNTCSADNKFFIVELCNDIQIDTIVLANYEFFSSSFRHFRVSVSDRYPVKMEKWRDLGTFEARNTREIQAFLVENPLIWAKFLRIEFLTHYGTEYYCPVSLLRVHGTTMIEDYRHEEDLASGEEEEEVILEAEAVATPAVVAQEPSASTEEVVKVTVQAIPNVEEVVSASTAETPDSPPPPTPAVEKPTQADQESGGNSTALVLDSAGALKQVGIYEPPNANLTCDTPTETTGAKSGLEATTPLNESSEAGSQAPQSPAANVSTSSEQTPKPAATDSPVANSSSIADQSVQSSNSSTALSAQPGTETEATAPPTSTNTTTPASSKDAANSTDTATAPSSQSTASTNSTRAATAASTSNPPPAQPSTQESFFKSFHKRLQQLESNSTLSLQYIEEQSRILRDAFSKVEKRQVSSTAKFLSHLNETVMLELHGFRQAYDQLWQSTVIELESQSETYQREMLALSARLTFVADELVWQKRMGIVQSTLLLLCLALVLFGRSGNGYLEVPLMQQMMNKSTAAFRAGWETPPDSPSPGSRSPVALFRKKIWRSKTEPTVEINGLTDSELSSRPPTRDGAGDGDGIGPDVLVEPPSPEVQQSGFEDEVEVEDYGEGQSSPDVLKKVRSGGGGGGGSKRQRKKPKKPPNWPQQQGNNGRPKSPLAVANTM